MNQNVILTLIAVIIGSASPAIAQYEQTESKAEYLPIPGRPLETRYQNCLDDPNCTIQEHLMLMEEMGKEMDSMLQKMNRTCMDMDYSDCISPRSVQNEEWHKLHNHIGQMMANMETNMSEVMGPPDMTEEKREMEKIIDDETGAEMSRQEPAAGSSEEPSPAMKTMDLEKQQKEKDTEKSWWQKIFRNDEKEPEAKPFLEYD